MGSFDATGADGNPAKSAGKVTDTTAASNNPAGQDNPFAATIHQMSSRPDKHQRVAQAADASGLIGGKSEEQFVKKSAEDMRNHLHLDKDASAEAVFNKMGEDGYKYFLAHPKEQESALKESGLTKESISPETLTKSIIQQRRAEEHLLDAPLADVEQGMYKKTYNDIKKHKLPIDYD
jgi:hypothetical protein